MTTRRHFLATGALAAAGTVATPGHRRFVRKGIGLSAPPRGRGPRGGEPDLKDLAHRALEAARTAGASYADVRFTTTRRRAVDTGSGDNPVHLEDTVQVGVGVRALSHGVWGFMADTELTPDMLAWLGRKAAEIGKAGTWPDCPPITLGDRLPAAVGQWQTPVVRDPFTISDAEYRDVMHALMSPIDARVRTRGVKLGGNLKFNFERQERTFASTDGAFTTQTIHTAFSNWSGDESFFRLQQRTADGRGVVHYNVPVVSPTGAGFEVFEQEKFVERLPEWLDRLGEIATAEKFKVPGRFDVVLDAAAVAAVLRTMGRALEVDRALGEVADTGGTSYLAPVPKVLGTQPFPAALTLTADRTRVGGAATVRWDDEGVPAQEFPLLQKGMVVDYATSREFVAELAPNYRRRGQTAQSRGCAGAENALEAPEVQTPNLRLQPGAQDTSFEELLAGVQDGMAILGGRADADQQQFSVLGGIEGVVYEVKQGKLVRPVLEACYMVRVPELWQNLVALGGERSAVTRGFAAGKGSGAYHSVRAPAARFRDLVVRQLYS